MTARMDALNMIYRDLKVAKDVSKMMELRRFDVEYTMYGSRFWVDGAPQYLISSHKDKIVEGICQRACFAKFPLPVESYTLMTTVPAGTEEDILRLAKLRLAQKLRDCYDEEFLEGFYRLATIENDDAGECILTELMERLEGLFCQESLMLFEGLLDKAYRAKHLKSETVKKYEQWLAQEYRQLEDRPVITDQFEKNFYGIAYVSNNKVMVYCNGEKVKVYDKREQLAQKQILVSEVYAKSYWYDYGKTIVQIRGEFETHLKQIFDEAYFAYLKRIDDLAQRVPMIAFTSWQEQNEGKGEEIKRAILCYKAHWGIKTP